MYSPDYFGLTKNFSLCYLKRDSKGKKQKGWTDLEKGEINIIPLNRIQPELPHDRQTEIHSCPSLNQWFVSLLAQTPRKGGIEIFL